MSDKSKNIVKILATCLLVEGGAYSAIYDLERIQLFRFETRYIRYFKALETGFDLDELAGLKDQDGRDMSLCIDFLREHELSYVEALGASNTFTPLDVEFHDSSVVQDAIIDVDESMHDLDGILKQLDRLLCRSVQIRSYSSILEIKHIKYIHLLLDNLSIFSVAFIIKWSRHLDGVNWEVFFRDHPRIRDIIVHSTPEESMAGKAHVPIFFGQNRMEWRSDPFVSEQSCGSISLSRMCRPNARNVALMRSLNGCLGGKISIDRSGQICNCPSMPKRYGSDISKLRDVFELDEFQAPARITKDSIDTCRSCEFRYVCSDCRAYTSGGDPFGKPSKCSYDPQLGKWGKSSRVADGGISE